MKTEAVNSLTITPYHRRHLQPIHDLLFHSTNVHSHLDWVDTDQWLDLGENVTHLAWQHGRLVGLLGLSSPLNNSSWIRLAGIANFADPELILSALWDTLVPRLRDLHINHIGLLAINPWIAQYASILNFQYQEEIITLSRSSNKIPPPLVHRPQIRVAEPHDISQLAVIDQAAFAPPWQMSFSDLRQAYRMASSCTVATANDRILGFQISSFFFDGAHLARLAVLPSMQGQGVGGALLGDLLERYRRRGITSLTVNTQSSNLQSRRLYQRFGFNPNGYDLPYWAARI